MADLNYKVAASSWSHLFPDKDLVVMWNSLKKTNNCRIFMYERLGSLIFRYDINDTKTNRG